MSSGASRWSLLELIARTRRWHAAAVVLLAAAVYLLHLGSTGLHSTEGHRAIPGWEALASGEWIPTRMFGALYARKPPGMPWAIAAISFVLGESEFSARLPSAISAILMSLAAYVFATRWFGSPHGLAAGVAQALMPRFWSSGRSADIEALLCLGVQIASFALVHALVHRKATRGGAAWLWTAACAAGIIIALLAKAHAGAPVVVGVLAAACLVKRSLRPALHPIAWGAVLLSAAALTPAVLLHLRAVRGEPIVSEDFSKFLWDASRLGEWAIFPFAVFISGLPASLALLFPWGPDARRECAGEPMELLPRMLGVARTLAIGFVIAVALYMAFGVTNDRYAMPALVLLAPLAAYVSRGSVSFFVTLRGKIARWMVLGSPLVLVGALLAGAALFVLVVEPRDATSSARGAAAGLASALRDGDEVWADGFVGAKPELLWYARREAAREGKHVRMRWMPGEIQRAVAPRAGVVLVLNRVEASRYSADAGLTEVYEGVAHTTGFVVLRAGVERIPDDTRE